VQHVATWSRESRLGMGDLQTPATYDGSLVMRRGQRFESARRLSFSIDLQEKWTKLRTSRFRSPCPLTPLAPVVPWLVVKQTHVGPTRNSLRDPRADTAKGELHGTASISCERHSVRYVPVEGRPSTPKSAGAHVVPRGLTRRLHWEREAEKVEVMVPPEAEEDGIAPELSQNPRRIRAAESVEEESAARTPERPPHNLPLELSSFVGRQKELAEVEHLLEHNAF
jgi:hypothetical protein